MLWMWIKTNNFTGFYFNMLPWVVQDNQRYNKAKPWQHFIIGQTWFSIILKFISNVKVFCMFDRHLESLQFKKLWLRRSKLCVKLRDKINTSHFNCLRLNLSCDFSRWKFIKHLFIQNIITFYYFGHLKVWLLK